ncbi:SPOR domain-containing protein [Legionella antarctica]|uniref:SPOR domain-containing protein n=1 Tax=Legionella antarctica TaxID=2708020 RepID=UPI001563E5F9|nr:SPOR domain-containing protein [Legionella antarctica]
MTHDSSVIGFSKQVLARTIYGIENAEQFNRSSTGELYIQAGSFLNQSRANQYRLFLQSKTTYPVKTIHHGNYYRVSIGPIRSSREVRKVADSMSAPIRTWPVAITSHQIPSSKAVKNK